MLSKEEAWKQKPLSAFKFTQENDLYSRRVGVTNHCFTHKCSGYCWRQETLDFAYEPDKHGPQENNPNPNVQSLFVDSKGQEKVKLFVFLCRMGFGYQLTYPLCGDRSGGQTGVQEARIDFNSNGQTKFVAERNHPRVVQEPVATLNFGANCDI
jgi:hypothetical protein